MFKKLIAVVLCAALLGLCGCAAKNPAVQTTDPANPTDNGPAEAPLISDELGRNEGNYNVYYDFIFEEEKNVPLYVCEGAEEAPAAGDVLLRIADSANKDIFKIVLRVPLSAQPEEGGRPYAIRLYAARDNRYLLGVTPELTFDEYIYDYDTKEKTLSFVGAAQELRFLGKTFFLRLLYEGETECSSVKVFSNDCELMWEYDEVWDMEVSERNLYLLSGKEETALSVISVERFFEDAPDLNADRLCVFPGYRARFGFAEYGRITLIAQDGSDLRTLSLSQALAYAVELSGGAAFGDPAEEIGCDLFSMTLPGMFAGKYVCESAENSVMLYYKEAYEKDESGFLFGVSAVSPEEAEKLAAQEDNNTLVFRRCKKAGEESYLVMHIPVVNPDDAYLDAYVPLRDSREDVIASLIPAAGVTVEEFDYAELVSLRYTGKDAQGNVYTLTFTAAESYQVYGELAYTGADGTAHSAELIILMLHTGRLTYLDETGETGYGELVLDGGVCSLTLSGPDGTWLNAEKLELEQQ